MVEGATILVCVPFVWRVHAYPNDYWRMTSEALKILFQNVQWQMTCYLVDGKEYKLVPRKNDEDGKWMARSELVAVGMKCSSMF